MHDPLVDAMIRVVARPELRLALDRSSAAAELDAIDGVVVLAMDHGIIAAFDVADLVDLRGKLS